MSVSFQRRGATLIALVAVGVVLCIGVGWACASVFESPAQREVAARAPLPGAVTAAVTRGELAHTVTARAAFARAESTSASIPTGATKSVVTANPLTPGMTVRAGSTVIEVNGRPLLAFPGAFPFYRDMESGMSGPDVRQLQNALAAAGFAIQADGAFGPATERAVAAIYARAGYSPPLASGESEPVHAATLTDKAATAAASAPPRSGSSPSAVQQIASRLVLPLTELIVTGPLPATLTSAPPVGSVLSDGAAIVVVRGAIAARASVAASISPQLRKGMPVTITPDGAPSIAATIQVVGAADKPEGSAEVTMTARDGPVPDSLIGQTGIATITIQRAAADALIVPTSAVVSGGSGSAYVLKESSRGRFARVAVTETATLGGRSAITVHDGGLSPGDRVKVG